MQFCVLAKISKRSISLWYQAEEKSYAPLLIKGAAEVPLFFYVNGNDFLFGNAARDRFLANDPNAFGNFFEIIKDPAAHFAIYGNKKPVKQLLYYGLEQCLSNFINTVLYKNDSIESYRPGFPLRFLFGPDIEDKEKVLVESLFTEAGYNNVAGLEYNSFLFRILSDKKIIMAKQPVLLLNGVDGTLYLQLYKTVPGAMTGFSKLPGQGADPRVKILARMIVEYIQADKSYLVLDMEKEIAVVLSFAASLLDDIHEMMSGEVSLSDGNLYYYNVRKRKLTEQLMYDSNEHIIYAAINDLLEQNNISVTEVCILLGSEEISTVFFSERLAKVYPNIKALGTYDTNEAMRILFMDIRGGGYVFQKKDSSPDLPLIGRTPVPATPKKTVEPPPLPRVPTPPPVASATLKSAAAMPPLPGSIPGLTGLIAKTGIVVIKISPVGKVRIEQKEYEAKSAAGELAVGTAIKVIGTEAKKYLLVERSGSPPLPFQKKNFNHYLN
jgi:hypothetical protein